MATFVIMAAAHGPNNYGQSSSPGSIARPRAAMAGFAGAAGMRGRGLKLNPPQPQRIADHAGRRECHGGGPDDRRQQNAEGRVEHASRDRNSGGVVDEGEE